MLDEHGIFSLVWVNDVLLCATTGDFNLEATLSLERQVKKSVEQRAPTHWALLSVNMTGTLPVPEAGARLQALAAYCEGKGRRHAAAVNLSSVQDQVFEQIHRDSEGNIRNFRSLDAAIVWLRSQGYRLSLADLQPYLPAAED